MTAHDTLPPVLCPRQTEATNIVLVDQDFSEKLKPKARAYAAHLLAMRSLFQSTIDNCRRIISMVLCQIGTIEPDHSQVEAQGVGMFSMGYSFNHITGDCTTLPLQYLSEHPRDESEYMFTTIRAGAHSSTWTLRLLVKKVAARAGITKMGASPPFQAQSGHKYALKGCKHPDYPVTPWP